MATGLLMLTSALACSSSDSPANDKAGGFASHAMSTQIVNDLTDQVIVSTYQLLANRLQGLSVAVKALQATTADPELKAAQQAWAAARVPWEQSEGFLFGPVDAEGFDPALDSWPVNRTDLDSVLASSDDLTADYVSQLDPTLKGFHTVEYLLFGVGGTKKASDFNARELQYLVAASGEMASVAGRLAEAWTKGIGGKPAWADLFKKAGSPDNSIYPSKQSAAEEIVRGMIGILDEVANGKIADPFEEQDTTLVESQFSFNSLADFKNNLRSVQNSYLGDCSECGTSGAGLKDYVASENPELDKRIKQQLDDSIAALDKIPQPFRDAILDSGAAGDIKAAQEAILKLQTTVEKELLPLILR
jgi:predicted lipoprotein